MMGQETRNKLTDYWSNNEVKKGEEFAILTNIIHQEWSDLSVKNIKILKGLKTQNLRDHMSEEELIFTALAELSTRQIAETIRQKAWKKIKSQLKKVERLLKAQEKLWKKKQGNRLCQERIFYSVKRINVFVI